MVAAFEHLGRYRRKGEDEISDFLLLFYERIPGLLDRFRFLGLPFQHFLLRTLRWQWNTFQTERTRLRRQERLVADSWVGEGNLDCVAEPAFSGEQWEQLPYLNEAAKKRLLLLALKAAPYLEDVHLEAVSEHSGVDLAWLQACQYRLKTKTDPRRVRRSQFFNRRGEAFYRRLMAEDEASRESDPARRQVHEWRAGLYRSRLASFNRQQEGLSTAPTHLEVANLLGMPKGSVDSGLYHLKKSLARVYSAKNDHRSRHQQRPQKAGT